MLELNITPQLELLIGPAKLTNRQLEVLVQIQETHSQTRAAAQLGISVPVLHRYIKNLEKRLGFPLLITTPNGSWLTPVGKSIVREYQRYQQLLERPELPTIGCTLVSQELLLKAVSELEQEGQGFNVITADDVQNRRMAAAGALDLVLFDDPQNIYEFEDKSEHHDIFKDTLVHVKHGNEYVKFRYGAQRLGFKFLELNGVDYIVKYNISDIGTLINSKYSYFINKSLVARANLQVRPGDDNELFKHMVMALNLSSLEEIRKLVTILIRLGKDYQ